MRSVLSWLLDLALVLVALATGTHEVSDNEEEE